MSQSKFNVNDSNWRIAPNNADDTVVPVSGENPAVIKRSSAFPHNNLVSNVVNRGAKGYSLTTGGSIKIDEGLSSPGEAVWRAEPNGLTYRASFTDLLTEKHDLTARTPGELWCSCRASDGTIWKLTREGGDNVGDNVRVNSNWYLDNGDEIFQLDVLFPGMFTAILGSNVGGDNTDPFLAVNFIDDAARNVRVELRDLDASFGLQSSHSLTSVDLEICDAFGMSTGELSSATWIGFSATGRQTQAVAFDDIDRRKAGVIWRTRAASDGAWGAWRYLPYWGQVSPQGAITGEPIPDLSQFSWSFDPAAPVDPDTGFPVRGGYDGALERLANGSYQLDLFNGGRSQISWRIVSHYELRNQADIVRVDLSANDDPEQMARVNPNANDTLQPEYPHPNVFRFTWFNNVEDRRVSYDYGPGWQKNYLRKSARPSAGNLLAMARATDAAGASLVNQWLGVTDDGRLVRSQQANPVSWTDVEQDLNGFTPSGVYFLHNRWWITTTTGSIFWNNSTGTEVLDFTVPANSARPGVFQNRRINSLAATETTFMGQTTRTVMAVGDFGAVARLRWVGGATPSLATFADWRPVHLPGNPQERLNDVVFWGDVEDRRQWWVAGDQRAIFVSPDGDNWSRSQLPAADDSGHSDADFGRLVPSGDEMRVVERRTPRIYTVWFNNGWHMRLTMKWSNRTASNASILGSADVATTGELLNAGIAAGHLWCFWENLGLVWGNQEGAFNLWNGVFLGNTRVVYNTWSGHGGDVIFNTGAYWNDAVWVRNSDAIAEPGTGIGWTLLDMRAIGIGGAMRWWRNHLLYNVLGNQPVICVYIDADSIVGSALGGRLAVSAAIGGIPNPAIAFSGSVSYPFNVQGDTDGSVQSMELHTVGTREAARRVESLKLDQPYQFDRGRLNQVNYFFGGVNHGAQSLLGAIPFQSVLLRDPSSNREIIRMLVNNLNVIGHSMNDTLVTPFGDYSKRVTVNCRSFDGVDFFHDSFGCRIERTGDVSRVAIEKIADFTFRLNILGGQNLFVEDRASKTLALHRSFFDWNNEFILRAPKTGLIHQGDPNDAFVAGGAINFDFLQPHRSTSYILPAARVPCNIHPASRPDFVNEVINQRNSLLRPLIMQSLDYIDLYYTLESYNAVASYRSTQIKTLLTGDADYNLFGRPTINPERQGVLYAVAPQTVMAPLSLGGIVETVNYINPSVVMANNRRSRLHLVNNNLILSYFIANFINFGQTIFTLYGQPYFYDGQAIYRIVQTGAGVSNVYMVLCNGMRFVGNFGSNAWFYSDYEKALFAFTGSNTLVNFMSLSDLPPVDDGFFSSHEQLLYLKAHDKLMIVRGDSVVFMHDVDPGAKLISNFWGCSLQLADRFDNWAPYKGETDISAKIEKFFVETEFIGEDASNNFNFDRFQITFLNERPAEIKSTVSVMENNVVADRAQSFKIAKNDPRKVDVVIAVSRNAAGAKLRLESDDLVRMENIAVIVTPKQSVARGSGKGA